MKEEVVVVRVEGLVKDFRTGLGLRRKRVLHGVSFTVRRGEIFGFVGPNGAGKTTTVKLLLGLLRSTAGRVEILDRDVRDPSFRRHVGYVAENPHLYDFLDGHEFLRFFAAVSGVPARERSGRIESLLETVGLEHAAGLRLRAYSKGMLQRIAIAQALVHDPEIVFLDEPMSGLDPIGRREVRELITHLRAKGKTIFMNTHILSDVEALCDRLAIIASGRIRFEGLVRDAMEDRSSETRILTSRVDTELALRLGERGDVSARGSGDRLELLVPCKQAEEILQELLAQGARVHAVEPARSALEDRFLEAVRSVEER